MSTNTILFGRNNCERFHKKFAKIVAGTDTVFTVKVENPEPSLARNYHTIRLYVVNARDHSDSLVVKTAKAVKKGSVEPIIFGAAKTDGHGNIVVPKVTIQANSHQNNNAKFSLYMTWTENGMNRQMALEEEFIFKARAGAYDATKGRNAKKVRAAMEGRLQSSEELLVATPKPKRPKKQKVEQVVPEFAPTLTTIPGFAEMLQQLPLDQQQEFSRQMQQYQWMLQLNEQEQMQFVQVTSTSSDSPVHPTLGANSNEMEMEMEQTELLPGLPLVPLHENNDGKHEEETHQTTTNLEDFFSSFNEHG